MNTLELEFSLGNLNSTIIFREPKNITLPLIFHLDSSSSNRLVERYLKGKEIDRCRFNKMKPSMIREVLISRGIKKSIIIGAELALAAIQCLEGLDDQDNPNNEAAPFLKDMAQIAFSNKYYVELRKYSQVSRSH